jgi:hypothetical protein
MKLQFSRVGGLSPRKYKPVKGKEPTFHYPPPKRDGLYAFIEGYTDPFLWAWNKQHVKDFEVHGYRRFTYTGHVWCHFVTEAIKFNVALEVRGSWVKVSYKDFVKLFAKVKHADMTCFFNDGIRDAKARGCTTSPEELKERTSYCVANLKDPYKRGLGGYMSIDHLEVFIEASECGKIR